MGAGLDDAIRGELIGVIASRRPDIPIHLKERSSGPDGMAPFVRRVVEAMVSPRPATEMTCARGGRLMAVPALKLDGAQALLAAWPEPRGEAAWATRRARRAPRGGSPSAARRSRRDEYWSSPTRRA